jgi:hypothetical protein
LLKKNGVETIKDFMRKNQEELNVYFKYRGGYWKEIQSKVKFVDANEKIHNAALIKKHMKMELSKTITTNQDDLIVVSQKALTHLISTTGRCSCGSNLRPSLSYLSMHKKVGEAYAIIQCPECKYKNAEANLDVPLKIPLFTSIILIIMSGPFKYILLYSHLIGGNSEED